MQISRSFIISTYHWPVIKQTKLSDIGENKSYALIIAKPGSAELFFEATHFPRYQRK